MGRIRVWVVVLGFGLWSGLGFRVRVGVWVVVGVAIWFVVRIVVRAKKESSCDSPCSLTAASSLVLGF